MPREGRLGNAPGDDVHLTPPEIWDRVRRVDPLVLDPCPHPRSEHDGLAPDSWLTFGAGVVYLNPPFSNILPWAERAVNSARLGQCVIVLVPGRTSQPYYSLLCQHASHIAFWRGDKDTGGTLPRRVRFMRPDGTRQAGAPFDTSIFLLSNNRTYWQRFEAAFSSVAQVVRITGMGA